MADFEGKITGRFVDDDDIVRTGRALIELDGFNMLRVPVPSDYWEFLDSAAGQVEAVSLDAERAVEAAGDATEQAGKAKQAADNAAASERAAIQAQVRSENAADRAETRVDEAINNGAALVRDEVKQDADRSEAAADRVEGLEDTLAGKASTGYVDTAIAAEKARTVGMVWMVETETQAQTKETSCQKGDFIQVAQTGNIYKVV